MKIKNKWGILALMSMSMFIIVIDTTIMNVSISALVADLNTSVTGIQSAISIYGLVMAAFILIGAKMADIIGKKRAFTLGIILFGIGTGTASISNSLGTLIIGWSIIEGLGSSLMMPNIQTILRDNYKGKGLAFAYGIIGAVGAIGVAVGPIVGGFLTSYYSWRWAFRLELAIVVFVLLMIGTIKKDVLPKIKPKFDFAGAFLSSIGLASVVLGILAAQNHGWFWAKQPIMIGSNEFAPFGLSITPLLMGFGFMLLMGLFSWEAHLEEKGEPGLFKPSLFKVVVLRTALNVRFIQMMFMAGFMFVFPLYLQLTHGLSAIDTGLALMPNSIALLITAILGTKLGTKFTSKRIIQSGLVLSIIGFFIMATTVNADTTLEGAFPGTIVLGFGIGLIVSQIVNLELSSVKGEDVAEASGLDGVFQQLGNSIGVAVIGSILISSLVFGMQTAIDNQREYLPEDIRIEINNKLEIGVDLVDDATVHKNLVDYGLSDEMATEITQDYANSRTDAFGAGMAFLGFLSGLALLLTIRMPNVKLLKSDS